METFIVHLYIQKLIDSESRRTTRCLYRILYLLRMYAVSSFDQLPHSFSGTCISSINPCRECMCALTRLHTRDAQVWINSLDEQSTMSVSSGYIPLSIRDIDCYLLGSGCSRKNISTMFLEAELGGKWQ